MEQAIWVLVAVIAGYVLGLLNNGVKVSVQQVPAMKEPDDNGSYPAFVVGSKEHKDYIAMIRRKKQGDL